MARELLYMRGLSTIILLTTRTPELIELVALLIPLLQTPVPGRLQFIEQTIPQLVSSSKPHSADPYARYHTRIIG